MLFPNAEKLSDARFDFSIDGVHAIAIIGAIQLALRHPKFTGPASVVVEKFARDLQAMVAEKFPETNVIMEMGWNPDFDI